MVTSVSRSAAELGLMSWAADPKALKYGVKIRSADHAPTDYGTFYTVKPWQDDTSDGTMDIPVSTYVQTEGAYEWIYMPYTRDGWGSYSAWQTVQYGTSDTPADPTPSPTPTDPTPSPTPTEPTPTQPSAGGDGIMSWTHNPKALKYGIKVREADHAPTDYGTFHSVKIYADDTSDGTMDVAVADFGYAPGSYEWIVMAYTAEGWGKYSAWQTVDYGGEAPDPTEPTPIDPAPTDPAPTDPTPSPTPTEPTPNEPGPTEPGPTEPGPTEPGPTEPGPSQPMPGGDGIMSWTADPNALKYGIKIRAADHGPTDYGTFHSVKLYADDTSDGTMDVSVANFGYGPGSYEWIYMPYTKSGWGQYSSWETVDYGSAGGGDKPSIMVIGDSFSIPSRGFPNHLDQTLDGLGYDIQVIDFAKSGDTAAQALTRLQSYLSSSANELPDMALIALGTNDAVQGLAPSTTKGKLDAIIDLFAARDIEVLLGEPDAYYPHRVSGSKGFDTTVEQNAFRQLYAELAAENDVVLARDFHDGLDNKTYLESDGFHPNQSGTALMASNIRDELSALVQDYQADLAVS